MATFSEQLESALGGSDSTMSASAIEDILSGSGTTIQPGTVTPTGGSVNWNQIFENITTKTPLKAGQGLPEVPKGIPASTFYREATKAGKLPSGASQFFVKPLAPETKALNFNTPTTPSTPTTTPSTSSNQNIVRQLRETAELEDIGGSEGNTQISYDDPSQQYSDTYSPTYAAKMLANENAFLTDTYSRQLTVNEMENSEKSFLDKNIENLGLTAKNYITGLPTQAMEYFTDKIDDIKDNPLLEAGKLAAGYFLPPLAGPFIGPLIGALTSEGMGQIGMPGLNKDDYWGSGGPDGRGVENRSTVAGFAEVPGYAMPVAVDAKGNVLSSPYGPVKGVVMYGFVTPAGTKAYENKGISPIATPNFNITRPNIGDQDDYSSSYRGSDDTGQDLSEISAPSAGSYPDIDDDSGMSSGSDSGGDGGNTGGAGGGDQSDDGSGGWT